MVFHNWDAMELEWNPRKHQCHMLIIHSPPTFYTVLSKYSPQSTQEYTLNNKF